MATHYEHAHYCDKMAYIRHTLFVKRRTHPPLRSCRDNAKLACHGPARYKMEWIYTQTKMSDQGSIELALIMKKKERKKERKKEERKNEKWAIFQTSGSGMYNCFDE